MRGNATVFDHEVLQAILDQNFIDCKNVAYNYDVTSDFTWDYKELVQIKKRKRVYNREYKPTVKNIIKNSNARKFE